MYPVDLLKVRYPLFVNGEMIANHLARLACKSYILQEEPFIPV